MNPRQAKVESNIRAAIGDPAYADHAWRPLTLYNTPAAAASLRFALGTLMPWKHTREAHDPSAELEPRRRPPDLYSRGGDCDDFTALALAVLARWGHLARSGWRYLTRNGQPFHILPTVDGIGFDATRGAPRVRP